MGTAMTWGEFKKLVEERGGTDDMRFGLASPETGEVSDVEGFDVEVTPQTVSIRHPYCGYEDYY